MKRIDRRERIWLSVAGLLTTALTATLWSAIAHIQGHLTSPRTGTVATGRFGLHWRNTSSPPAGELRINEVQPNKPRLEEKTDKISKPLLAAARRVAGTDDEDDNYCWVSNHQLLVVTTEHESGVDHNDEDKTRFINWKGHADRIDIADGSRARMAGLTRVLNRTCAFPATGPRAFRISPLGNWLLWESSYFGDGYPMPRAARLNGTRYRTWDRERWEDGFFLDDRHYFQINEHEPMAIIRDLRNRKRDRVFETERAATAALQRVARGWKSIDVESPDESGTAKIVVDRTEDSIQGDPPQCGDVYHGADSIRSCAVRLPQGAVMLHSKLSPGDPWIVYQLLLGRGNKRRIGEQTVLGSPAFDALTEEIWVSRSDGSGIQQLGAVEGKLDTNGDPDEQLSRVEWLPGGNDVSFVYRHVLYVLTGAAKQHDNHQRE